jgi:transcriptional regulator with XRE-family HTH domain
MNYEPSTVHRVNPLERQWLDAIGIRLRVLRLDRQLTQRKLAILAHVSESLVNRTERGLYGTNLLIYQRLARALDVPLSRLLPPDD